MQFAYFAVGKACGGNLVGFEAVGIAKQRLVAAVGFDVAIGNVERLQLLEFVGNKLEVESINCARQLKTGDVFVGNQTG